MKIRKFLKSILVVTGIITIVILIKDILEYIYYSGYEDGVKRRVEINSDLEEMYFPKCFWNAITEDEDKPTVFWNEVDWNWDYDEW